jgi:hypothetical protein
MSRSAVKPKPQPQQAAAVDVDALINRGGTSPDEQPARKDGRGRPRGSRKANPKNIMVLFDDAREVERLDDHLAQLWPPVSRSAWIIQAIREKAKRDGVKL